VVPALQTQQYPIYFHGVRLDGVSFYHSTYNNLYHQNMVVCLGVRKVEERVLECEDSEEASYYISYALGALKMWTQRRMWKVRKNRSNSRPPSSFSYLLVGAGRLLLVLIVLVVASFKGVLSLFIFPEASSFSPVTISLLACSPGITLSC
jgi:hypothetical protein